MSQNGAVTALQRKMFVALNATTVVFGVAIVAFNASALLFAKRTARTLPLVLAALMLVSNAWAQSDNPYGADRPCVRVTERASDHLVVAHNPNCDLRAIPRTYPQVDPETNKPLPMQTQLRSLYAANQDRMVDGKKIRRTVMRGCVRPGKPSPDADAEERSACPDGLMNYYSAPADDSMAMVTVPFAPALTYGTRMEKLGKRSCAALASVANPTADIQTALAACNKEFGTSAQVPAATSVAPQTPPQPAVSSTPAAASSSSTSATLAIAALNAENQSLKNQLAGKERELEELAKTGRVIGAAVILPWFPPLQGWSMAIVIGAFALAFVAVGMGAEGARRNRRQEQSRNVKTLPPNLLKREIGERDILIRSLEDRVSFAEKALVDSAVKVKAAEESASSIRSMDAGRARKLNEFDEQAQKLAKVEADAARLRLELATANEQVQKQRIRVDTLNANLGEVRERLNDVTRIEAELEFAIKANEGWQLEVEKLQAELKALTERLEFERARVASLEELKDRVVSDRVASLEELKDRVVSDLVFLRAQHNQTLEQMKQLSSTHRAIDASPAIAIGEPSSVNTSDVPGGASSSVDQDSIDSQSAAIADQAPVSDPPRTRPGIGLMGIDPSDPPSLAASDQDETTATPEPQSEEGQRRWTPYRATGEEGGAFAAVETPTKTERRMPPASMRNLSDAPSDIMAGVINALRDPSMFRAAITALSDEDILEAMKIKVASFVPDSIVRGLKILTYEISLRRTNGVQFEADITSPDDVIAWHDLATLRLVIGDAFRFRLPEGTFLAGTDLQVCHFAAPVVASSVSPAGLRYHQGDHIPTKMPPAIPGTDGPDVSPDIEISGSFK